MNVISNTCLNCRKFTKVPHFPGDPENFELAKDMAEKWRAYGIDVIWKNYSIMLSRPKDMKAGAAALYNGSILIHKSAPQERFLVPSENNSKVVPPFNAYAPSGSAKVSVDSQFKCLLDWFAQLKRENRNPTSIAWEQFSYEVWK